MRGGAPSLQRPCRWIAQRCLGSASAWISCASGTISDEVSAAHQSRADPSRYCGFLQVVNVTPRYAKLKGRVDNREVIGWENIELIRCTALSKYGCTVCCASGLLP
jgi:hypothetical protein